MYIEVINLEDSRKSNTYKIKQKLTDRPAVIPAKIVILLSNEEMQTIDL